MSEHPAVRVALNWLEDPAHEPSETLVVVMGPTQRWVWDSVLRDMNGRPPLEMRGDRSLSYLRDEEGRRVIGSSYTQDLVGRFAGIHKNHVFVIFLEYPTDGAEVIAHYLTQTGDSKIERFISV